MLLGTITHSPYSRLAAPRVIGLLHRSRRHHHHPRRRSSSVIKST